MCTNVMHFARAYLDRDRSYIKILTTLEQHFSLLKNQLHHVLSMLLLLMRTTLAFSQCYHVVDSVRRSSDLRNNLYGID